jgi:DNA-binding NtrC family response regulator
MIARGSLPAAGYHPEGYGPLVGRHPTMQRLYGDIERVARRPLPIVVWGPTGTGKELVARAVHAASGRRGRYVALNVHALPETLAEAELFGVVRGAYTGATASRQGLVESASGGTLMLDEANELPLALQAKLLRVLEAGEFRPVGGSAPQRADFRLIIATQERPAELRSDGRWRSDFYYRVTGYTIQVPSLCDRISDLELLVGHVLRTRGVDEVASDVLELLRAHKFPGNVRELIRILEQAHVRAGSQALDVECVRAAIASIGEIGETVFDSVNTSLVEVERAHIARVLRSTQWDIARSSLILGLSRSSLYRKLRRHGLRVGEPARSPTSATRVPNPG